MPLRIEWSAAPNGCQPLIDRNASPAKHDHRFDLIESCGRLHHDAPEQVSFDGLHRFDLADQNSGRKDAIESRGHHRVSGLHRWMLVAFAIATDV